MGQQVSLATLKNKFFGGNSHSQTTYPKNFTAQHVNSNLDESPDVKWLRKELVKDFKKRGKFFYHGEKEDDNNPILVSRIVSKKLSNMMASDIDKVIDEIEKKGFVVHVTFKKIRIGFSFGGSLDKQMYDIEYSKYKDYKYRDRTTLISISAYCILNGNIKNIPII